MIFRIDIAVLMLLILCSSCTKIHGTITSEGEALGNWILTPEECITGDRERTVGATLYTEKNPALSIKIAKNITNNMLVAVTIPSTCGTNGMCKAVILDSRKCSKYSADVALTNDMTPDDYRQSDGHLLLDCVVYIGLRKSILRGDLTFTNCN